MVTDSAHAVLLISCPDQKGLTATISNFIYDHDGNIEHADQHVDKDCGIFFMRIEWSLAGFTLGRDAIEAAFAPIAERYGMDWSLYFSDYRPKVALFVSHHLHCLHDLLYRYQAGHLHAEFSLIISNHDKAAPLAKAFGIDYLHFPIDKANKLAQEQKELQVLRERNVECVVLARYMQILSEQFVDAFPYNIINIHHSFLPAFVGGNPYAQAYRRGVKIVGATSHYVTEELDAGPIIEQDVVRVTHRDEVSDMQRKGEDLEKVVLSRAVQWHLQRKILVYQTHQGAKTVIFD